MTPQQMAALGQHAGTTAGAAEEAAKLALEAAKQDKATADARKRTAEQEKRDQEERVRQTRAMDAAQRLFSMNVANLPGMVIRNVVAGRSPLLGLEAGQSAGGGAVAGATLALVGMLGRVLGDGLRSLLAQPTSGAAAMNKSFQLLTATVAGVLMPATFLVGVAALAASEILSGELAPAVRDLTDLLLQNGIPAINLFVAALKWGADGLRIGLNALFMHPLLRGMLGGMAPPVGMAFDALRAAGGAAGGPGKGGVGDAVRNAIRDMLDMLRSMSFSTPVASGGPASAWSRAQQAAAGGDAWQRRMMELMVKAVANLEKAAAPWLAKPGGGAFDEKHIPDAIRHPQNRFW